MFWNNISIIYWRIYALRSRPEELNDIYRESFFHKQATDEGSRSNSKS